MHVMRSSNANRHEIALCETIVEIEYYKVSTLRTLCWTQALNSLFFLLQQFAIVVIRGTTNKKNAKFRSWFYHLLCDSAKLLCVCVCMPVALFIFGIWRKTKYPPPWLPPPPSSSYIIIDCFQLQLHAVNNMMILKWLLCEVRFNLKVQNTIWIDMNQISWNFW